MKERNGKYGLFIGCTSYPKCRNTYDIKKIKKKMKKMLMNKLNIPQKGMTSKKSNIIDTQKIEKLIPDKNSDNWISLEELVLKLEIKDDLDRRYLKTKLKTLEQKEIIESKLKEEIKYWKKLLK